MTISIYKGLTEIQKSEMIWNNSNEKVIECCKMPGLQFLLFLSYYGKTNR